MHTGRGVVAKKVQLGAVALAAVLLFARVARTRPPCWPATVPAAVAATPDTAVVEVMKLRRLTFVISCTFPCWVFRISHYTEKRGLSPLF